MKTEILKILKTEKEAVSAEKISDVLKASRIKIWHQVKNLREDGYKILLTSRGYELVTSPDIPFPWEFPEFEDRIHFFPEVSSTMEIARDMARKGAPNMTVVIADHQKRGRGRMRRPWFSDKGGLYFTVIVRPEIPPSSSFKVNFSASLAMVQTINEMYPVDAGVKWPNDILVGNKKLSGMLSEMETKEEMVSHINVGMGINVNNDPTSHEPNAVSLKSLLHHDASRKNLLGGFLANFNRCLKGIHSEDIVGNWKQHAMTLNRPVKIVTFKEETSGIAKDVDETGALVVELPDGTLKKIIHGDCFHQSL